ncbi:hypothetical protein [Streptomyces sp. NPDC005969]|uniref:hypothetical protein n=1 Tax=Streptomyces sp. NPDC005969 TaxID=3156722 RepID=UPI0033C3FF5F
MSARVTAADRARAAGSCACSWAVVSVNRSTYRPEWGPVVRSASPWHQKMLETRLTDAGREALRLADEHAVRS